MLDIKELETSIKPMLHKAGIPKEIAHWGFLYVVPIVLSSVVISWLNIPFDPQASLSLTNLVGSILTAIYSQKDAKRIESILQGIHEKINSLEEKIDRDFAKKDEFEFLLKKVWANLADEYRPDMIEAYSNMIVNFATITFSKKETKAFYLNLLVGLTPLHLLIIHLLDSYFTKEQMDNESRTRSKVRNYLFDSLRGKIEDSELDIIDGVTADLVAKGILREDYAPTIGGGMQMYVLMPLAKELLSLITTQIS